MGCPTNELCHSEFSPKSYCGKSLHSAKKWDAIEKRTSSYGTRLDMAKLELGPQQAFDVLLWILTSGETSLNKTLVRPIYRCRLSFSIYGINFTEGWEMECFYQQYISRFLPSIAAKIVHFLLLKSRGFYSGEVGSGDK